MSWTKRQIIEAALGVIGISSYSYDLQPEQYKQALTVLDAMVAGMEGNGIRLGYLLPSNPDDSSITDDSGLPDIANEAVYLSLGIALCPFYGKTASIELKSNKIIALNSLTAMLLSMPKVRYRYGTPLGAGNMPWLFWQNFVTDCDDSPSGGNDGKINYGG